MAISEVSVSNRALHKLGAASITSLDDDEEKARVLKAAFEPVRRSEIRKRRWRFAIKRVSLPALSAAPDSDYSYQYQLPNDYLRLIEGGDIAEVVDLTDYRSSVPGLYSIEGRVILTNIGAPLAIRYIADITDVSLWDASFGEAFAARLAFESCYKITESTTKAADLRVEYKDAIKDARQANALERATESIADDTWIIARGQ